MSSLFHHTNEIWARGHTLGDFGHPNCHLDCSQAETAESILMIVPITSEASWLSQLKQLPAWHPSGAPILLVAPHPDDEILGAGGLLAEQCSLGVDVSVVAVTDGEHAYPDGTDSTELGNLRCAEQTAALQRVGVPAEKIIRLRLPDSDVTSHLAELIARLTPLVSRGSQIIAPWRGDFHPDHESCGIAAAQVARKTGATLTSYFFWTWHRGTPQLLEGLNLRSFPLSVSSLQAKSEALLCHRSQLFRDQAEPILPKSLLGPAERSFETFLVQ
jgi:LmbE family N-acetylglucosaminyl deacetylase